LDLVSDELGTNSEEADAWPAGRQVPAAAIRTALLHLQRHPDSADPSGLRLAGADILGRLDLDHMQPPCLLRLDRCRLAEGLTLEQTRIPGLALGGSRLHGHKDLPALQGSGATIAGDLRLSRATLTNERGPALTLDGARIGGNAFLDEGFTATGEVRALGATITGHLPLSGATLTHEGGPALVLDGASIGGSAFLDQGFTATGEVRALGATITGQLSLRRATLTNDGRPALVLDLASIGGSAFLDQGFTATGEVRAPGATVTGQLNLRGATLTHEGGDALNLDGASIGNDALLEGLTATGEVSALGATITGDLRLSGATLTNEHGDALNLDGASIGNDALLEGLTATGEVSALGASITGQLSLRKATLTNERGPALDLDGASIGGAYLGQGFTDTGELGGFTATGEVRALGATITGQLNLDGATLTNPGGDVLNLEAAQVRELRLRGVAKVEGRVSLADCQIAILTLDAATEHPPPGELHANGWRVEALHGAMASDVRLAQQWLDSRPDTDPYSPQPARELAEGYDRAGHPDKARRLRYAAARQVAADAPWWAKPRHWLYGGLVGHGYYPLFTLGWLAALFLCAAVLATTQAGQFVPSDPGKASDAVAAATEQVPDDPVTGATSCQELGDYPCFSPWAYALQTVVPPAAAVQATAWQPTGWVLLAVTALKGAGWVLVALLLAGITGLLRRA
jgi:hypothetical protein